MIQLVVDGTKIIVSRMGITMGLIEKLVRYSLHEPQNILSGLHTNELCELFGVIEFFKMSHNKSGFELTMPTIYLSPKKKTEKVKKKIKPHHILLLFFAIKTGSP